MDDWFELRSTMKRTCRLSSLTTLSGLKMPDRAGRSARATIKAEATLSSSQWIQP